MGLWECYRQVKTGGMRALYTGFLPVLMRNTPGFAVAYGTFEYMKQIQTPIGDLATHLYTHNLLLAGGVSGAAYWMCAYPADVLRANMQGQINMHAHERSAGVGCVKMSECARALWKEGGWRRFYRGLSAALVRAVPVNAVTYCVYSLVVRHWQQ
eukprot:GDKI01003879.1.p1 GENE.GDKI01003879.1~~GDKI01003879.1.p1  ORF type:complete len:164 (+),score=43.89 GDKI01003879.1:30-494(+)